MATRRAALAASAARPSGGVLTSHGLRALGHPLDLADREVRAGRWQRAARGTYLLHDRPPGSGDLARAAAAHVGGPCVVTALVAGHLLGLRWLPPARHVEVLVDARQRVRSSGLVRVHRVRDLELVPRWTWAGVPVATPDRAVVDAARASADLREVRGLVLGAVQDGWADVADLTARLEEGRRNGSALVRRALVDAARGCASPPEAELVDALVGRRVPFLVNPELTVPGTVLGSPDLYVVGSAVGGEVESDERHGDGRAQESTYDRHERFAAAGVELVHLSVARLRRDPDEAASYLLSRAQGRPAPPGLLVRARGPVLQ